MKVSQAVEVVGRVKGFWPTPTMTAEEETVWMDLLTDPKHPVAFTEAMGAVSRLSASEAFRPRPGAIASLARGVVDRRGDSRPRCSLCIGTGWRLIDAERLPCVRGAECSGDVNACGCVVPCGCDGGRVDRLDSEPIAPAAVKIAELRNARRRAALTTADEPF